VANDETGRLLSEIGQLLARDTDYPLNGTLLYAEVDDNYVAPSIYKNTPDQIVYRHPDLRDLGDALLDLWRAQTGNARWEEIEYVVRDGKFDATFTYPEEIDRGEDPMDRRDRIVKRHFGDKPIFYPPWPYDDDVPRYEL
jgi:hypothetical protein